jgi:hypothetical protein
MKRLLILAILCFLFNAEEARGDSYRCAVLADGYSEPGDGYSKPPISHFAALVYDDSSHTWEVWNSYYCWNEYYGACTWFVRHAVPQNGQIIGLSVVYNTLSPTIYLSYSDGKTYKIRGGGDPGCCDNCWEPTSWILVKDFGFLCLELSGIEESNPSKSNFKPTHLSNYPNPFSISTQLSFEIDQPENVIITIYDVAGQEARILEKRDLPAGVHAFYWDGKNDNGKRVASGMYFYTVKTARGTSAKKVILLN